MNIVIRFAKSEDVTTVITLCEAHAHYEKAVYNSEGKARKLASDLFSIPPKLYCLVIEYQDQIIGYATYMKQYSTWDAEFYIYMDCLYLKEEVRGIGIGRKLVSRIQQEAKILGCSMMQWQTPDFNTGAIKFYEAIGAVSKPKSRFFLTL